MGDGLSCTLDSDSDGYPDKPLDSTLCDNDPSLTYCTTVSAWVLYSLVSAFLSTIFPLRHFIYSLQDVCPEVRDSDQDPRACKPIEAGEG